MCTSSTIVWSHRLARVARRARFVPVCLLALAAGTGGPAHAQAPSRPAGAQGRQAGYLPLDSARQLPAALLRPVTLRAKHLPLESALQSIARQAGLGISYGEQVARSEVRVTVWLEGATAAHALREVVRGSAWQVLYTPTGQVTLVLDERRAPAAPVPGEVVGRVTGSDGRPVPGATVAVEGSAAVGVADARGRYAIRQVFPGTHVLRASAPGYQEGARSSVVAPGKTASANIRLAAKVVELEELVAIGYGAARRRDLTGSIASVSAELLVADAAPTRSVSTSLLGRVPGVQVVSNLGTPGASATLQIRGANSIAASPEPLYVLDGVPISPATTPMNTIDPNTVESIQVLKDASATAIYGARGANGVVLITTRRGTRASNRITVETSYGLQRPARFIEALGAQDFMRLVNEGLANAGSPARYTDAQIAAARTFDYPRAMLHDLRWQPQQSHALTVSGGDETTRYLVSGNLLRQEGIVINSGFERAGLRVNLDRRVKEELRFAATVAAARSLQRVNGGESTGTGTSVTGLTAALMFDPTLPPRDPVTGHWNQRVVLNESFWNPIAESTERRSPNRSTTLLATLVADYEPADGLLLRSTLAGNFNFGRAASFSPSTIATGMEGGTASQSSSERRELTNENTLTYRRALGPGSLEVLAGASIQTSRHESFSAESRGFPIDDFGYHNLGAGTVLISPASASTAWTLLSQLGRVNYNLLERYLFTVTARRDGSSRFGENDKWAVFPSAAFAWRAIDEPALRMQTLFSDLKLRLSYGRTGNQAIAPYQSLAQLATVFTAQGTGTDVVTLAPTAAAGNPDLKWETQTQYNLGADVAFLDGRVAIAADLYQSSTDNLLLTTNLPWTSGFSTQVRNVGAVRNRGVEIGITTHNWDGRAFRWWTTLNLAANRNTVTELYGGLRKLGAASSTQVGEPLNTFVGYRVLGLYQQGDACDLIATRECEPGEYRIQDTNGDRVINDNDRVNLGNAQPDFYGGLNSSMTLGPVSLDAFFNFSRGNEIHNSSLRYLGLVGGATNEIAERSLRRWTPRNTDTDVPRANILRPNNRTYSSYVEDGSFLRLQTLSLGVDLPPGRIPGGAVESARLTVTGQNLWIATPYTGFDPEQQAVDPGGYPHARTWNVGLNLSF